MSSNNKLFGFINTNQKDSNNNNSNNNSNNVNNNNIPKPSNQPNEKQMKELVAQITTAISYSSTINPLGDEPISDQSFQTIDHKVTIPSLPLSVQTFEFKEISAVAFKNLREKVFKIPKEVFETEWILPEELQKAKLGAGRSGSLFTFSKTKRYIGKTILASEVVSLAQFLPVYFDYVTKNDSFIMKLLGLFRFNTTLNDMGEINLLVFENVLWAKRCDYYPIPKPKKQPAIKHPKNRHNNVNKNQFNNSNNSNNNNAANNNNNINNVNNNSSMGNNNNVSLENVQLLPIQDVFDLKGRLNKTKRYHNEESMIQFPKFSEYNYIY